MRRAFPRSDGLLLIYLWPKFFAGYCRRPSNPKPADLKTRYLLERRRRLRARPGGAAVDLRIPFRYAQNVSEKKSYLISPL